MTTTTESPNVTATGTVGFSRKVQVRQYEAAEASIFIQFDIPTDDALSPEEKGAQVLANAKAAFFQAKALVFDELGLEFELGDDGVVRELVNKTFGGTTEVVNTTATEAPSAPAPSGSGDSSVAPNPPYSSDTRDRDEKAANKKWALARYEAFPNEFFDNRPKKASGEYSPKSPDLKHKNSQVAVWLS